MSSASVCVYTGAHLNTHTHACRLVVAWHMRIKYWASARLCVCECVLFFFSSLFSALRAKWRRCSCWNSYRHTHTHALTHVYILSKDVQLFLTHTYTCIYTWRALNANDAIFGWARPPFAPCCAQLSLSVALTIYCYCDNVCALACNIASLLAQEAFKWRAKMIVYFSSYLLLILLWNMCDPQQELTLIYMSVCVCMRVGVHAQQIVKAIIRTYK